MLLIHTARLDASHPPHPASDVWSILTTRLLVSKYSEGRREFLAAESVRAGALRYYKREWIEPVQPTARCMEPAWLHQEKSSSRTYRFHDCVDVGRSLHAGGFASGFEGDRKDDGTPPCAPTVS